MKEIKGPTQLVLPGCKDPVEFGVLTNIAYRVHNEGTYAQFIPSPSTIKIFLKFPEIDYIFGHHSRQAQSSFDNVLCDMLMKCSGYILLYKCSVFTPVTKLMLHFTE